MAKLKIPERYRAGVSAIRELDDADVQAIRNALDRTEPQKPDDLATVGRTPSDMAITAVRSAPSARSSELKKSIAEAVAALYGVRASRDISIEAFADEVCDALESLPEENLRLPSTERAQFERKLIALLGADVFAVISKIGDLTIEHERTLCHAHIVTDLRPVFGLNVQDGPKAMLIVHNLKLAYHKGSEKAQDFYVSLNRDDLRALRQLIDRAEAKAKALEAIAKDMPILGVSKE